MKVQPVTADDSRQVAESARERGWARPSFGRELFLGRLALDLIHPFPRQRPADVDKGEAFLKRLSAFLSSAVDPLEIEREARIPAGVIKGLADLGAFGMNIPEEYGGLGLSQVHGFMHQSGGAVDLTSVVGQGTTVTLYLPAAREAMTALDTEPADHHPAGASRRVLVVDDDIEVADLAGQLLEGCGYTVKLVHRAKAALDLLDSGEPVDLLFSDIIMPGGMNGVQLAEEVRRRFPALPILLSTGYSDANPEVSAKGLPIIVKPYNADALCARLGELLQAPHGNGNSTGFG